MAMTIAARVVAALRDFGLQRGKRGVPVEIAPAPVKYAVQPLENARRTSSISAIPAS
ncbi:hypothetical protein SALBM217S_05210 [Streptomyces griseoloalbus]